MKLIKLMIFFVMHLSAQNVDFIIFSYNRPLQLYALLESTAQLVKGLNDIFVIYRADDADFERGYALVRESFATVHYLRQGNNPAADFKPLTLQAFHANPAEYVLFGVDDIVVKDVIDLDDVIKKMEQQHAYGFYLRLGLSLDYSYVTNKPQPLPALSQVDGGYTWYFNQGVIDWGYPHTVDMAVYRKKDIVRDITQIHYVNPNTFEGYWAGRSGPIMYRKGMCYEATKMVNLPLNRVNKSSNRHMDLYSARELLDLFLNGKKMDVSSLLGIKNRSAHIEYEPIFVDKEVVS